jgi:plasmid maintenance system killer protein
MILTFRDTWLRRFFTDDIRWRGIHSDLEDTLFISYSCSMTHPRITTYVRLLATILTG